MSSAEQCWYVAVWEFSPWGKMISLSTSLILSQSQFCVPHIFTLQSWYVADDLPRTWENHSKTHQVQPIALREAKQSMRTWRVCWWHLLRLLWYPVYEWEWVDENPAATCWTRTIKFTLFPSLLGEPGMSLPVCRYCLCCGDYRCSVKNSGDRMTKVNKDMKPQVRLTYTQSLVFLTPSSCWNWSAAHLIFHSDCCWQKTQGASSRCLSDNPLSGGGMFVWGWRAWDRGINVEHRYPDTSGRCLLWSCFSCFEIFCECTSLSQKHE